MAEMWSLKVIQDIILDNEQRDQKNLYATDSEKCPCGVYYALKGEEKLSPIEPRSLRRMEVGTMIEYNQVKKLKSLGLLIDAQSRLYDETYRVSGRHDGIVISPDHCSDEAKALIQRKREIDLQLNEEEKAKWSSISEYHMKTIDEKKLIDVLQKIVEKTQVLHTEDHAINEQLLVPDERNQLIVQEVKSIVQAGFKWRQGDNEPMSSHTKQIMFYLWKLREKYPWIEGRVLYVSTDYQDLLEFVVKYDEFLIEDLKRFWSMINQAVDTDTPPPPAPAVIQNEKTGNWMINKKAEWCPYHIKCTGDPEWMVKAKKEVTQLNKK